MGGIADMQCESKNNKAEKYLTVQSNKEGSSKKGPEVGKCKSVWYIQRISKNQFGAKNSYWRLRRKREQRKGI